MPPVQAPARVALEECPDVVLVDMAQAGGDRAATVLVTRYGGMVRARAAARFLVGADHDDLCQEGLMGLCKAIRDFDTRRAAPFAAFADLCITRQIVTAIRAASRRKHAPLNSCVPLDSSCEDTRVATGAVDDPLETVVADDAVRSLTQVVDEALSGLEASVLALTMDGRSYCEIAELLDRRTKCIDNARQRIRRKLTVALELA